MPFWQRKNRLGYWRKIKGLTQREVARKLCVAQRTICNWELDITDPTWDQAEALAEILGVTVRELFPCAALRKKRHI